MNSKSLIESVELAKIVRKLIPKKKSRISEKGKNQESILFREIGETKTIRSDEEIIAAHGFTRRRYQQILSEINTWLADHVLDLELPASDYSEYARRLFALDRAHANLRILQRLGGTFSANEEAKRWWKEAIDLEEWDIAISLLSPMLNWASLSGDAETYDHLSGELPRLRALDTALMDARDVIFRVQIVFAKSGAEHKELLEILQPAIERLRPLARELGTFRLEESLLLLRRTAQQVTLDYPEAVVICNEMDALLARYPLFANRSRKSRNTLAKLMCHVQMKHRTLALEVAESSQDLFSEGDQNWYSFQEWRFILFMHLEQYPASYELVQSVMSLARFSTLSAALRERWKLFLCYAELKTERPLTCVRFGKNEQSGALHERLMREFPSFHGDYAGYEMAAIVLEILALIDRRRSDVAPRIDSLRMYKARHLQGMEETQSGIFVSLVELLELYDFDRAKITVAAPPLLARMLAIKTIDWVQAQQVMPYEMLWAMIVELLPEPSPTKIVKNLELEAVG